MPVYARVEDAGGDFLATLQRGFRINIIQDSDEEVQFDFVGADAPIANALRRILLAEVPSVAIETVYFDNNTSIIQDEVLAHRLGLIPIKVDPSMLEMLTKGEDITDLDTLVFTLRIKGGFMRMAELADMEGDDDVEAKYTKVYSRDLTWVPQGAQSERFTDPPVPVHGDILLAKLAPGQEIQLQAFAHKGVGRDHAKFSPVATAAYRLLPDVRLLDAWVGEEARALVDTCPMKVFDIEDVGRVPTAVVARPRDCTVCRECIREPEWAKRISLERVMDHFIFSVESVGAVPARDLVQEACRILKQKAEDVLTALNDALAADGQGVMPRAEVEKATIPVMRMEPDSLA